LDVTIYNMTENPDNQVFRVTDLGSASHATWTTYSIDVSALDDDNAPDLDAADETAVLFLTMHSLLDASNCTAGVDNGCYVRIGDIILNYLAKY